jgi:nucleoside-diphosphate-sugar epimerase
VKVSRWTYAVSKLAGEHLSFAFHREFGLPVASVRPFNVYGPRQVGEGAVPIFVARALADEPIVVHNDGSQLRAWLFVDDFVEAFVRVLDDPKAVGETFNVGNPIETVSVLTLAQKIVRLCGSRSEVRFEPYRPDGDVRVRIPSIEKAESLLGWKPGVSLDDGLARTIAWHREAFGRK